LSHILKVSDGCGESERPYRNRNVSHTIVSVQVDGNLSLYQRYRKADFSCMLLTLYHAKNIAVNHAKNSEQTNNRNPFGLH
jgi:hypothetical protein